ncbi:class I SAM-dependent methyltransferase [Tropicibacter sp. S64]|uniref:class I SAM-dependent methyltransferase n=1 Tax=Tropicibacter sp. S64 TaxID=3415122 RepID=UPI003C7A7E56
MTAEQQSDPLAAIVDTAAALLSHAGLADGWPPFDVGAYRTAQRRIEPTFEVPQTTISPVMRRMLFHIGYSAVPRHIYAAGSYVGFAFAWLVAGRDARPGAFTARGTDIDARATQIATRNLAHLRPGGVTLATCDAREDLRHDGPPIDLLFIDVDEPDGRKDAYTEIARIARGRLAPGALVLAHDPLVPLFARDFARYHAFLSDDPGFGPTVTLPLDDCGLDVTRVS